MGSETSKSAGNNLKNVRERRNSIGGNLSTKLAKKQSVGNISNYGQDTKFCASSSCYENLLGADLITNNDSKSQSGSNLNFKPKRIAISQKNKQLIQNCFQNPHENLGRRIFKRAAEKRKDFGRFYMSLTNEQRDDIEETIKTMLKKSVANIGFIDEVQKLAMEFGERFVKYRAFGFKADYFATIGDSTITECVFLDNAVHQAHQTLSAFSQFITMLFSSIRDGFYKEMKRLRCTSTTTTSSNSSIPAKKLQASRDASPRSFTSEVESFHNSNGSIHSDKLPAAEKNDQNVENNKKKDDLRKISFVSSTKKSDDQSLKQEHLQRSNETPKKELQSIVSEKESFSESISQ